MSTKTGYRVAVVVAMMLVLLAGNAKVAYAAPHVMRDVHQLTAPGYDVRGAVQQVSGLEEYGRAAGAQYFDVKSDLGRMTGVGYFIVAAQPETAPNGPHFQIVKPAGIGVVRTIEVAVNPVTHTQLVAVGLATTGEPAQPPNGQIAQSPATQGAISAIGGQATASASGCWNGGYLKTYWYDPVGITVNYVKDIVNWCWNGTYVTSYSGSDSRYWLSDTGWYEVYGGLTKYFSGSFTWGEVYTNDRFVNPNFAHLCNETDTYYRPNGYIFYGDGTSTGDYNTWVTGSCYFMLHYAIDIL